MQNANEISSYGILSYRCTRAGALCKIIDQYILTPLFSVEHNSMVFLRYEYYYSICHTKQQPSIVSKALHNKIKRSNAFQRVII